MLHYPLESGFFGNKVAAYISTNWRGCDVTSGLFDPYRLNALRGISNNHDNEVKHRWRDIVERMKTIMSSKVINQENLSILFD